MVTNKKLGKGLSSLLGKKEDLKEASTDKNNNTNGLLLVPIEKIFRDEQQPRKEFDQEKIKELSQSIHKNGLIQPLILTKRDSDTYTLVAGERRWRAAQLAKLKILPSLLLPTDLDKDEISLIENIQRVGKSRSHITNLLRILGLDDYFFDLLNRDILSMGHARALIGKTPNDFDEDILLSITKGKISVRDLEMNKKSVTKPEPNLIHEEKYLSDIIGFKTKIVYNKSGKGNIKIFYENLEQYNFLIKKLKN